MLESPRQVIHSRKSAWVVLLQTGSTPPHSRLVHFIPPFPRPSTPVCHANRIMGRGNIHARTAAIRSSRAQSYIKHIPALGTPLKGLYEAIHGCGEKLWLTVLLPLCS
ncbi:hypothetical protein E2C01_029611 [Portunus trituberculatus]|uniref:Uncharacterized protein n=1 Tax=Portunus trituberculatus TaxID=210409 RepID=A0A5B7EV21_PORTR|nr:hypothetical protein [Portunus trituberculatus]